MAAVTVGLAIVVLVAGCGAQLYSQRPHRVLSRHRHGGLGVLAIEARLARERAARTRWQRS